MKHPDIKAMRDKIPWSAQQLADESGVSQPTIWRIENEHADPKWSTLDVLVDTLEGAGAPFIALVEE